MALSDKAHPDEPGYPRVYCIRGAAKKFLTLMEVLFTVFIVLILLKSGFSSGGILSSCVAAVFAGYFFYLNSQRITLSTDSIEKVTRFSRRHLSREEIEGWRVVFNVKSGDTYVLVPKDERSSEIRIHPMIPRDAHFIAWMKSFPHLKDLDRHILGIRTHH